MIQSIKIASVDRTLQLRYAYINLVLSPTLKKMTNKQPANVRFRTVSNDLFKHDIREATRSSNLCLVGSTIPPYGQFIQPRDKLFETLGLFAVSEINSRPTVTYFDKADSVQVQFRLTVRTAIAKETEWYNQTPYAALR